MLSLRAGRLGFNAVAGMIGLCIALAVPAAALAFESPCTLPDKLLTAREKLPRIAAKIARGEPIKIVALGSSSTAGVGASSPAKTYPARLEVELQRLIPRSHIAIVNKGIGGDDSEQMMLRFKRDVLDEHPDLLIWQTGTNAALKRNNVDAFSKDLQLGLKKLRAAHIDVMFMTPQQSPRFDEAPNHQAFTDRIEQAAKRSGAPVIRRYDYMKYWKASGQMTTAEMINDDGLHMTDLAYDCLARSAAQQIAQIVRPASNMVAKLSY